MVIVEKNKVCVHSIYFEYSFIHEMLVNPDYVPGSIGADVDTNNTISYKLEESIGCILEDDFTDGSVAEENGYNNIDFTPTQQNSLGLTIKQSGVWFIQNKCDDCCKTLKTKKVTDLNESHTDSLSNSVTIGSPADPILNGNRVRQWLSDGGYIGGAVGLQNFMQNLASVDASLFAKVKECLKEQASKFNKNGYLKGKNDQSQLSDSLKVLSEKIDTYLSRKLTCNNSQAACDSCVDIGTVDLDPTFKSENEVFLESNFITSASKLSPLSKKHALITLEKNKSWVKN